MLFTIVAIIGWIIPLLLLIVSTGALTVVLSGVISVADQVFNPGSSPIKDEPAHS
ncbi:MAG: hypothetical protein VKP57_05580 [Candidatus Sericytochromatia bacterium]|jgi:hypothetical protein|nr:hypothetical protein [Candidatus Sericytochromatia bacterium]